MAYELKRYVERPGSGSR